MAPKTQKTFTGEERKMLADKRPVSTDDLSDKWSKYIEHHTVSGTDVKRRKLQENQRLKGRRWFQPANQPAAKAKAKAAAEARLDVTA